MSDMIDTFENPEILDVIEGLLGVTIEREKEIADLTVELELLKRELSKFKPLDKQVSIDEIDYRVLKSVEVMIADGNGTTLNEMAQMLMDKGVNVVATTKDGSEVVRLYKETLPTVLALDSHMPRIDGYRIIKEILEFDPDARIVMLSRSRDRTKVLEAIQAGAADYICKPFNEDRLIQSLYKLKAG